MLGVLTSIDSKEAPVSEAYAGRQFVGIDLHRRRSVMVRMTEAGEHAGDGTDLAMTSEYLSRGDGPCR